MPRIDTKTGRDRLTPRREPYWHKHAKDRHVGFRKLEDGPGTWIARYRGEDGKRQYRALGELSEALGFDQAIAAALAWFTELDRGVRQTSETVADACKAYVDDRRRQKGDASADAALRMFERTVFGGGGAKGDRHKVNAIAGVPLSKIRRRMVETWLHGLVASGLSKSSANRTLTTLRAALNLALRDRHVSADVAAEWRAVQPYKGAEKRRDLYLDRAQRGALIKGATGAVRDLIEAAALTGARAGELVSAKVSAFDGRTKSITLTGKTGSRTVPLSPAAAKLFTRRAEDRKPDDLLLTRDDGQAWAHSDWDELVRAAAADAKLPEGTCLYTLRHSWITAALTDGMSPLEVSKLVGTSLRMIDQNYGHLANASARERLAKLKIV